MPIASVGSVSVCAGNVGVGMNRGGSANTVGMTNMGLGRNRINSRSCFINISNVNALSITNTTTVKPNGRGALCADTSINRGVVVMQASATTAEAPVPTVDAQEKIRIKMNNAITHGRKQPLCYNVCAS